MKSMTSALKSGLILLFLMLMLVCCEDDNKSYPDTIFGKWKFIKYTSSTVMSPLYAPNVEGDIILNIEDDGILTIRQNEKITFETKYEVAGDTLKIVFGNDTVNNIIEKSYGILILYEPLSDTRYFYKRLQYWI